MLNCKFCLILFHIVILNSHVFYVIIIVLFSLRKIVPAESSWSMASVGRMTITLKKATGPDNWTRLTKGKKKPNNIHFWWELHEKHAKELEALDEDEDSEDPVVKPPVTSADVHVADSDTESNGQTSDDKDGVATDSASVKTADGSDESKEAVPDEAVKPKKTKKKKVKKEKKSKTPKTPSLDDLIKELEKAGKERKKDVDRKAKADKEEINKETEEKIKELKRDFYKSKNEPTASDDSAVDITPPVPTEELIPKDSGGEKVDAVSSEKSEL
jgi:hypothetical protein